MKGGNYNCMKHALTGESPGVNHIENTFRSIKILKLCLEQIHRLDGAAIDVHSIAHYSAAMDYCACQLASWLLW